MRPNLQQLEALADFLDENPGIAKGLLRTAYAKTTTRRKWQEVSSILNSLGGALKDGKGWAKYWADKKCALKKVCSQHVQSISRTGSGPAEALPSLNPIDQRLVAVMGGLEFAAGDSQVVINPFPTSNITSPLPVSVNNIEILSATPPVVVTPACSLDMTASQPISSQRERSPVRTTRPSNSRRSQAKQATSLNENVNQFTAIEQRRVEAEAVTADALREAAVNISSIAISINNLAAAVTEAAQIIAQAMSSNRPNTN